MFIIIIDIDETCKAVDKTRSMWNIPKHPGTSLNNE